MTFDQARARHSEASKYQVVKTENNWQVITNIDPPWQYFMREENSQLYLIGFWDKTTTINCRLQAK